MKNSSGQIVVISAPSGGGKNTIIAELITQIDKSIRLVTTTTRAPRPGEVDGIDYYFLDRSVFEKKQKKGDFLEVNEYAGNLYGTDKAVLAELQSKYDWIFAAVDVEGKKSYDVGNIEHISIFIAPESLEILHKRLVGRGSVPKQEIEDRLAIAKEELSQMNIFDTVIVNKQGELRVAIDEILAFLGLA